MRPLTNRRRAAKGRLQIVQPRSQFALQALAKSQVLFSKQFSNESGLCRLFQFEAPRRLTVVGQLLNRLANLYETGV